MEINFLKRIWWLVNLNLSNNWRVVNKKMVWGRW